MRCWLWFWYSKVAICLPKSSQSLKSTAEKAQLIWHSCNKWYYSSKMPSVRVNDPRLVIHESNFNFKDQMLLTKLKITNRGFILDIKNSMRYIFFLHCTVSITKIQHRHISYIINFSFDVRCLFTVFNVILRQIMSLKEIWVWPVS